VCSRSTGLPEDGHRYSTCLVQSAPCGPSHFCGSCTRTLNHTPPYRTTRGNTLLVPFGELPVSPWVYYNYFGARGRTAITIKRPEFMGFQMIKYTTHTHTHITKYFRHIYMSSFWPLTPWCSASISQLVHPGWLWNIYETRVGTVHKNRRVNNN